MNNKSSLLQSLIESTELKFTSDNIELEFQSLKGWIYSKVDLNWSLDIEYRDWGVKGIMPFVPDQKVHIIYEEDDEDGNSVEKEMELELKNVHIKFEPSEELVSSLQIMPIQLEVTKQGVATVTFQIS